MVVTVTFRTIQARVEEEMTQRNLKAFFERQNRRNAFLSKYICPLMVIFPLAFALGVFGFAYYVAGIVFAIQATNWGADTYDSTECEHTVGKWLLTFGCLGIFAFVMSCCGRTTFTTADGATQRGGATPLESIASFAQFCWVVYGVHLMYNREDELKSCNESQWNKFHFIVSFTFFGAVAMFTAGTLLMCMSAPVFLGLLDELSRFSGEERPILTEAFISSTEVRPTGTGTAYDDPEAAAQRRSVMDF